MEHTELGCCVAHRERHSMALALETEDVSGDSWQQASGHGMLEHGLAWPRCGLVGAGEALGNLGDGSIHEYV